MKKFRKNLCLFLALIMCLGMVNISALAATFDDLQAAIDDVFPETPSEPSDPYANGTKVSDDNGGTYGYGWNSGNADEGIDGYWGIHAWDDADGNRNVQLNEDVEEPEHTDPDSVPTDPAVTIDAGDKVTIDLNGNDIDGSGRGGETIVVENGGNLTLTGNAEDEGKVIGSDGHNVVTVTGKDSELTLEDGVNITHDAGNKLENMPEANPVVPADPDPADPADPAPAADGDEEADTPETPEAKKPTFSTGKTDENGKTTTTTGRGVEVDGGKLTMNGGKITDNNVGGEVGETSDKNSSGNENGNFEGKVGGGVFVHDGGTFEMNDGEISNNAAAEGGGVFVGTDTKDANTDHSSIKMTGGKVDGNVAKSGEGGGIYIRSTGQNSEDGNIITGGDITGNATFTTKDLGGGGIYVESNGGELTIKNAVIRNNTAEGLGGGISACVHGETVIAVVDGAIIYGNHANGETHSTGYKGTDNAWTDGTIAIATDKGIGGSWVTDKDGNKHWQWNTDFANAAQDIFTASSGKDVNSQGTPGIIICSEMLNGIQPGWSGIGYELCNQGDEGAIKFKNTSGHWFYCRPVTITAEKDDDGNIKQLVVTSERAIGLTAGEISDADKALIEKFVNQPSRVLIEGNYSAVHGGAIGNNGRLNIGTYSNDTIKGVDTVITIDTNKKVTVKNPESVGEDMRVDTDDDFKMEGGEFTFELVQDPNDSDTKVLWTAQNTADGKVDIRIPSDLLQNAGTHTFYLREQTGDVNGITYDGAVYKIVVTVAVDENDPDNTNLTIGKDTITVQKLTATKTVTKGKLDADGNWVEDTDESGNSNASAEFNNTYTKKTEECVDISVRKTWDDNNDPNRPASVTIRLIRNDVLFETITLNGTNNWNHQWKGLDLLDEQGHKINWTVEEVGVDGYTASYGTVDHNTQRGFDVTVTNSKNPEEPGPEPTPTPDPEPTPTPDPEPDIPDPDVPTTEPDPEPEEPVDIPDEETPTTDIPDEETPTTDLPDEEPPLTELPEEPVPLVPAEPELELPEDPVPLVPAEPEVELPEDPVPLANVPQTGDISLVWYAVAAMSAMGLAVLTLKKREDEEN